MNLTFLSDEWLTEAQKLRAELGDGDGGAGSDLTINVTVTGGPEGDRELHLQGGQFAGGHVDDSPTSLTVPFEVARKMFLEGDQQAAMQAFMSGQIKVQGDMTKLMAMQGSSPADTQAAAALAEKLKAITA
jgi:hypothetical protein